MWKRGVLLLAVLGCALELVVVAPAAPERASYSCFGKKATIVGTARNDSVTGTRRSDVIVGLGGNDVIYGRGGNDFICGDAGSDRLYGGVGVDQCHQGSGKGVANCEIQLPVPALPGPTLPPKEPPEPPAPPPLPAALAAGESNRKQPQSM